MSPKSIILTVMLKKCKKSAVKPSKETFVLLNFVNISTILCPLLSEKTYFIFLTQPRPHWMSILQILVFYKSDSLLKLIFRATDLQQRPIFDILEKPRNYTLASSWNFVLKIVPSRAGQYFWRGFTFFY